MKASEKKSISSATRAFAFRGLPHQDLKKVIQQFAVEHRIKAAAMVTTVGSLEQVNIRYANQPGGHIRKGYFEIVSLVGTVADSGCHLHISVSDNAGQIFGGHLLEENLIYTTAEIVLMALTDIEFHREIDTTYNFNELVIKGNG